MVSLSSLFKHVLFLYCAFLNANKEPVFLDVVRQTGMDTRDGPLIGHTAAPPPHRLTGMVTRDGPLIGHTAAPPPPPSDGNGHT